MAIQNDSTLLCKGDLKAYHESIAPYLGGNLMVATNVSDYYSTDEKIVGVWTDKKPIYQKTINFGTLPNNAKKAVAHGISNIEKVVSIDGSAYGTTGGIFYAFTFPNVGTNNQYTYDIAIDITGANIDITTQTDRTFLTGVVTIKYTKTTDAANSAVITPGCYDINFPNIWPQNTEIYFGNGVYGYRATGPISLTAKTRIKVNLVSLTRGTSTKFINYGGTIKRSIALSGASDIPISQTFVDKETGDGVSQFPAYSVSIEADGIAVWGKELNTINGIEYDLWFTYTK